MSSVAVVVFREESHSLIFLLCNKQKLVFPSSMLMIKALHRDHNSVDIIDSTNADLVEPRITMCWRVRRLLRRRRQTPKVAFLFKLVLLDVTSNKTCQSCMYDVLKVMQKKGWFFYLPTSFPKRSGICQGNFNCNRWVLFEIQSITRGTAFGVK